MCQFAGAFVGQNVNGTATGKCVACGFEFEDIPITGVYDGHCQIDEFNGQLCDVVSVPDGFACPNCGEASHSVYFSCEDGEL